MRVLFVVSEYGYTWEEIVAPWIVLTDAGAEIVIATPTGAVPKPDPESVTRRSLTSLVGYGISGSLAPDSERGRELMAELERPTALADIDAAALDAIYIAGGHGALFDLHEDARLHDLVRAFDVEDKPVAALCHASSVLGYVEKDGAPLIQNKKVTGFPTALEHFILTVGWVNERFLPLPIWTGRVLDERSGRRGLGLRLWELLNPRTVVADGNIVTGVGPKAGGPLARKMLKLGKS